MNTLFYHSAPSKGKPRVTVAGIVQDNTLRIGVSRCSHKDVYVRKLGNVMAQGRALSKKAHLFELQGEQIPQFIGIAATIIKQEGGILKERK